MTEIGHAPAAQDPRAPLQQLVARWNEAAQRWDASALAHCYTSDATLFGGRPGHSVGQDSVQAYFSSYAGVIRCCTIALLDQEVTQPGPELVIAQGHVDLRFVLQDGRQTTSLLRSTLILRFEDAAWKIWRHHFSPVPDAPPLGD